MLQSAACIAFAVVLVYLAAKRFTKRFERLLQAIRRVERENFDIPESRKSRDEIGQVSFAFVKMARRIQELINDVYKKELDTKEAEMNLLQSQINPHFLYNSLASISSLAIQHGDSRSTKWPNHLARFYRISLNKGKQVISETLKSDLLDAEIMAGQLEFLLQVHYAIDEELYPYRTIKLILQPFIENWYNHAIWDPDVVLTIQIRMQAAGGDVLLQVIDDGAGMRPEQAAGLLDAERGTGGYGIRNVNERLKLQFGEPYGVSLLSRPGIGTQVRILIPRKIAL